MPGEDILLILECVVIIDKCLHHNNQQTGINGPVQGGVTIAIGGNVGFHQGGGFHFGGGHVGGGHVGIGHVGGHGGGHVGIAHIGGGHVGGGGGHHGGGHVGGGRH